MYERIDNKNKKKYTYYIMIFMLTAIAYGSYLFFSPITYAAPDEMGTLAAGAYIAGFDWSELASLHGSFYGYGTAWFIAPLFKICENGLKVYYAARLINCFFISLSSVVAFYILDKYFCVQSTLQKLLLAISSSLFTNVTVVILYNEPLLTLINWILILMCIKLTYCETKRWRICYSLILEFLLLYSLTLHTRSLLFFISVIVTIFVVSINKRTCVFELRVLPIGIVGIFLVRYINTCYQNVMFSTIGNQASGGVDAGTVIRGDLMGIFNYYGLFNMIKGFMVVVGSNVWGLVVFTTYLLIPISYIATKGIKALLMKKELLPENIIAFYSLMGLIVTMIMMGVINCWHGIALLNGEMVASGRFFFYLRYYIQFLPPMLLLFGSNHINVETTKMKQVLLYGICFGCIISKLYTKLFDKVNQIVNTGGIFSAYTGLADNIYIYILSAVSSAVIIIIVCIFFYKGKRAIAFSIILFLTLYMQNNQFNHDIYHNVQNTWNAVDALYEKLNSDKDLRHSVENIYVSSRKIYKLEYAIQILFPELKVYSIDKDLNREDVTLGTIIFSDSDLDIAIVEDAFLWKLDDNEYIYSLDNDINELMDIE